MADTKENILLTALRLFAMEYVKSQKYKNSGDTELKNFLLFCPKCKLETLINVRQLHTTVIKEPDAKPKSFVFYISSET